VHAAHLEAEGERKRARAAGTEVDVVRRGRIDRESSGENLPSTRLSSSLMLGKRQSVAPSSSSPSQYASAVCHAICEPGTVLCHVSPVPLSWTDPPEVPSELASGAPRTQWTMPSPFPSGTGLFATELR
jgi:hypothetical protein